MDKIGDVFRELLLPLILVVTVGGGSAFITSRVNETIAEQKFIYIDSQIDALKEVVSVMRDLQLEISRRGEWMTNTTADIEVLQARVSDRYTRTEAVKDIERLEKRIMRLEDLQRNGG